MRSLSMLPLVVGALGLVLFGKSLQPDSAAPAFLFTVAKRFEPLAWMHGGDRFAAGAAVYVNDAQGRHVLTPDFAASADPAISFDGKTVLFAGKRTPEDSWQIWEVSIQGGDAKRITNCREGCVRPLYLPEDRIVYAEKVGGHFVIQSTTANGNPLSLTHGPENYFPTDVLRDGRILFQAGFPVGQNWIPELYTVYSDGSGVESYRCDHGASRHSGKQVASGDIVFADDQGLGKFTSALARQAQIPAPKGQYGGDVAETASGQWLLSWRRKTNDSFQLMWWDRAQNRLQSAIEEKSFNLVQPVIIAARSIPNRHPSGLHDSSYANLLCLNAYTSKYKFTDASIHSVRLYTRGVEGKPLLLGTAPVEADGSFFVQVPGDQPLQIELLDSAGNTLKREQAWFWMRGGEQRACVGCHAGPEAAPENVVPQILLKSTTPADMTHSAPAASTGGH